MTIAPTRRAGAPASRTGGPAWPGLKVVLFGVVVLSLVGLVGLALARELAGGAGQAVAGRPAVLPTPRRALSGEEELYARALWPLHNEIKAAAIRLTLGGINYKTQLADRAAFRERVERSLAVFRQAEPQVQALRPPSTLRSQHDRYVEAIGLYIAAAVEMAKVADDGRDEHLTTAFPMSQRAGQALWEIGDLLWPGEYVPN